MSVLCQKFITHTHTRTCMPMCMRVPHHTFLYFSFHFISSLVLILSLLLSCKLCEDKSLALYLGQFQGAQSSTEQIYGIQNVFADYLVLTYSS